MAEAFFMKSAGGALVPVGEADRQIISKWKVGQGIKCKFSRLRNIRFHRKFFAMLDLAFDVWEPPEVSHNGMPAIKNRERFRKDLLIASGFYETVVNINGQIRAEAKSMSFDSMGEDEFNQVYSAVADVILQRILRNYTRSDLDSVVDEILGFVS